TTRIIVADRTADRAARLARPLQQSGLQASPLWDPATVLDRVAETAPDLVLLADQVGDRDGPGLCRDIVARGGMEAPPVLLVLDAGLAGGRVRALESGARDVLSRGAPDDAAADKVLVDRVRALVRQHREQEQWRLHREATLRSAVTGAGSGTDLPRATRLALVGATEAEDLRVRSALSVDSTPVETVPLDEDAWSALVTLWPELVVIRLGADPAAGLALATRLRTDERTRRMPILMIGAADDPTTLTRALQGGVDDVMAAPLDDGELLARVRALMRLKRYREHLHDRYLRELSLAFTDALTGLHNRHYLISHLDAALARRRLSGKPLSLLMVAIDRFKDVNQAHGHPAGDRILAEVARRIAGNVRIFDLAARLGGEKFVVVMPDTGAGTTDLVAGRLRDTIRAEPVRLAPQHDDDPSLEVPVTVSIGAMTDAEDLKRPEDLLDRARGALDRARESGGDAIWSSPAPVS
ncbi:MAG: diguanylate cyclase, partial [Rhodobacterales bacterium]|nr:diguanylate cyclase [Rhodobacterales bacterium]